LKFLASIGCGASLTSEKEIKMAFQAGFDPKKMVFNGKGKLL
jgi:diaminopimelate decarboxylase